MQHKTTSLPLLLLAVLWMAPQLSAQDTRALFSQPGLSLGAYHLNIYDGTWSTSWRYANDTILCGDTLLVFEQPSYTPNRSFLKIQNGKVWLQSPLNPCNTGVLYYDFNLNIGQNFQLQSGGPILQVVEKGQKTLLNGEMRRYLRLSGVGWNIEWIEGLGDIGNGLYPAFYDFEGYDKFVCARNASGDLWLNPQESDKCDSLLCAVPIPQFTVTSFEKTATFINTSLNASSWLWEFGDGQTSTEQNPVHTYSGPGCYEVCLSAYSACLTNPVRQCLPTPVCIDPAWVQKPQPAPLVNQSIIDIQFINPDTGWLVASRSIWKTTDGGQQWTQQTYPAAPAPVDRRLTSLYMLNAQTGIISCGNFGGNGSEDAILMTNNGGQTWEERNDNSYFLNKAILTADGQGFATGQFKELRYSNDGGQNWSIRDIPGSVELSWMQYMGGDTLYAFGYQGLPPQHVPAFIRTFDAGLHWQITQTPTIPVQSDAYFLNKQEGWAVGGEGYLLHTIDAGQSWQPYFFGESVSARSIAFADEHHGWAVGDKGLVLHTTHGGFDWQRENCGYLGNMRNLAVAGPDFAYANGKQYELLGYSPGLFPNCGVSTWETEAPGNTPGLHIMPNPVAQVAQLQFSGDAQLQPGDKIVMINALGQVSAIFELHENDAQLDLSQLPAGCYGIGVFRGGRLLANGRVVKL